MKKTWLWIILILLASLLLADGLESFRGTASLPTRLSASLKTAKQHYNGYAKSPDSVQAVVLHKLIAELKRSTPRSLAKPTLVVAYVIDTQDGAPRKLAVTWIADKPMGTAILVARKDIQSQAQVVPIPEAQRSANRSAATDKVVFSAHIPLTGNSKLQTLLQTAGTDKKHPFITLECNGKPCSNTVPCLLAEMGKLPTTNQDSP